MAGGLLEREPAVVSLYFYFFSYFSIFLICDQVIVAFDLQWDFFATKLAMMDELPAKLEASGGRCSRGRARRRLVQSTLFPCKRVAEEPSRDGEDGLDVAVIGEEGGIEVVGSHGADKTRTRRSLPRALI